MSSPRSRPARRACCALCAWSVAVVLAAGCAFAAEAPPDGALGRALLVGCTTYDFDPEHSLAGPINDVALVHDLLVERFGFDPQSIRRLTEGRTSEERPTKANITREMDALIAQARKGQPIVLFFAGHGCQQPDQSPPDPNDPEPDGLDEVFLPADIGPWSAEIQAVPNAIVDDDFRRWTGELLKRGAELFVVIDSCHSGSALRGGSEEKLRRIDPEDLIPKDVLAKAAARKESTRGAADAEAAFDPLAAGGWVALYAAQPGEPTPEAKLPKGSADARPQGVFTFAVCQALREGDVPSYRELIQRVRAVYLAQGRYGPTPMIEGQKLDRRVLGARQKPPSFQLERDGAGLFVRAGQLHGLTSGSILAVRKPDAPDKAEPVGHVQVVDSGLAQARLEPCEYAKQLPDDDLPAGGLCRVVFIDYGDQRLRVAVDAETTRGVDAKELFAALESLSAREDAPLTIVGKNSAADWFVSRDSAVDRWLLVPRSLIEKASGLADEAAALESRLLLDASDAKKLESTLRALNKATNLLALAARLGGESASDGGLAVELELVHHPKDAKAKPEVVPLERLPTLPAGDKLQFRVANRGRSPVDFTLLFVDSAFGIESVFPRSYGADNRLDPGKDWQSQPFTITAETMGREHAVLFATESGDTPISFAFLAQPSLALARQVVERGGARKPTPFENLLRSAAFGGATRGLATGDGAQPVVQTRSWVVKP